MRPDPHNSDAMYRSNDFAYWRMKMPETVFTAEELSQRRERLYDTIGDQAVAVFQASDYPASMDRFRQYNEFYYFTGIEVAHAYALIDGRSRKTTLFLPRESQIAKEHDDEIPSLENADFAKKLSGAEDVKPVEALGQALTNAEIVYAMFRASQGEGATYGSLASWQTNVTADPWDGRVNRSTNFINLMRNRYPNLQFKDLVPIVQRMRLVKSPREIDLCRRAGQLSAIGVCDAMRSTVPGVYEYQLDAIMRYHYVAGGARDVSYPAIVASGANTWHGHYMVNQSAMQDGDMVLADCAPDYHYYTSDIGRMWPINGKYTDVQRELYGFVVEYHKVLLAAIRPGRTYTEILEECAETMRAKIAELSFSKPIYKQAAEKMCEFVGHLSHAVGMCVHDGSPRHVPLEVGMVFSVDPQMLVPEERLYIRCEDTIVVTRDGIENFTADAPLELDDVEKMMTEPGMLQGFPPLP